MMELPLDIWNVIYDKLESSADRYNVSVSCRDLRNFFDEDDWVKALTENWERKAGILKSFFSTIHELLGKFDSRICFYPLYTEFKVDMHVMHVELQLYRHEYCRREQRFLISRNNDYTILSKYNIPIIHIRNLVNDMNKIADCICEINRRYMKLPIHITNCYVCYDSYKHNKHNSLLCFIHIIHSII